MRSEDWYRQHDVPLLTPEQELTLGAQIQAWINHPDGPDAAPPAVQRRGRRARDRFVRSNVRLVFSIAGRYRNSRADRDDLIQEGMIGLQRAAEKFDPSRGYKFSTYAYWWIRQGMQRSMVSCRSIRLPADYGDVLRKVAQCRDELTKELGRSPRMDEIQRRLEFTDDDMRVLATTATDPVSLHVQPGGADPGCTLDGAIPDDRATPDEWLMTQELQDAIDRALVRFPAGHRYIVDAAWGLGGVQKRTVPQLARETGQRQPRIKAILREAQYYLRHHLRTLHDDCSTPGMRPAVMPPSVGSPYIAVQPMFSLFSSHAA